MKTDTIKTMIECPECNAIQEAQVQVINDYPYFDTHIHTCNNCGYVIMESEWNEVSQFCTYVARSKETNAHVIERRSSFKFKNSIILLEIWATTCAINLTGFSCEDVIEYLMDKCRNEYMNMSDEDIVEIILFWKRVKELKKKSDFGVSLLFSKNEIHPRNLVSVVYNHRLYYGAIDLINEYLKEYIFEKDNKLHFFTIEEALKP